MENDKYKFIAESLLDTFREASHTSIELYSKGLKVEIKEDGSPVSNGDLTVNEIISEKINKLTPDIPIISEETVDLKKKMFIKIFG